jgi:hypothetical protein
MPGSGSRSELSSMRRAPRTGICEVLEAVSRQQIVGPVAEAREQLADLLRRAEDGRVLEITRHGRPEEAWQATWANLGPWLGVNLLIFGGSAAIGAAMRVAIESPSLAQEQTVVLILGAFVALLLLLLPPLSWGYVRFSLSALDGRARISEAFSGFAAFGACFTPMLGLGFAMFVLSLPGTVASQLLIYAGHPLIGFAASMLWSLLVMSRLYLAVFFLVDMEDEGVGPGQAIARAWSTTRGLTLRCGALMLATGIVSLAGFFVLVVGIIPASVIGWMLWFPRIGRSSVVPRGHESRRARAARVQRQAAARSGGSGSNGSSARRL